MFIYFWISIKKKWMPVICREISWTCLLFVCPIYCLSECWKLIKVNRESLVRLENYSLWIRNLCIAIIEWIFYLRFQFSTASRQLISIDHKSKSSKSCIPASTKEILACAALWNMQQPLNCLQSTNGSTHSARAKIRRVKPVWCY